MPRSVPVEFVTLVDRLTESLPQLLGSDLVGLYAYGSLLDRSFVPGRSDLDCIAVTEQPLDDQTFGRIEGWLSDAAREDPCFVRLQMSLLIKDRILEDDPTACLYQFGTVRHSGSDGTPIIWLDFFQRGLTLLGPDPRSFVPTITPEVLHEALVREVGYLREEISLKPDSEWRDRRSYRAYAVLTLCRILYSEATGAVTSKSRAAEWAVGQTPDEFHRLIRQAKGVSEDIASGELPISLIESFINFVEGELTTCLRRGRLGGDGDARAT